MKKVFLVLIVLFYSGCMSLGIRGDYRKSQSSFEELVSQPFSEADRKKVEQNFKNVKMKLENGDYSENEKKELGGNIDYYLLILEDLKD